MIKKLSISALILFNILLASAVVNAWTHGTVAQSILTSLQVIATDPNLGDSTNRYMFQSNVTYSGNNIQSGFSDAGLSNATITSNMNPGGVNNAGSKTSWYGDALTLNYHASGQKFAHITAMNCYGMGDCGPATTELSFAGGPVSGDEGSASVFQNVNQQKSLVLGTQSGASVISSCNTTITQNIVAPGLPASSFNAVPTQAVTVASTTGCNVNDWLAIDVAIPVAGVPTGDSHIEAVQITAVGGGTITAAFKQAHTSGAPVKGALTVNIPGLTGDWGQNRVLVNHSGTTYNTGTVSSISGGQFNGSGTTWANNMVGGTADNIGCVRLANDRYTGYPGTSFGGSGVNGPLDSWYQIYTVPSTTSLGIYAFSIIGYGGYSGNGAGAGVYEIKPCVQVLQVVGTLVIAENTSTTWSNGDNLELVICPFPDVTQFQYSMAKFGPGGNFRGWTNLTNSGARKGGTGITIDNQHMVIPGVITAGGTSYTNGSYPVSGTYPFVPVTGGAGSGMTATVGVSGNAVTTFIIRNPGTGYRVGDLLSVNASDVGGTGSGFQFTWNGADTPIGWNTGLFIEGTQTGIDILEAYTQAILLGIDPTSSKIAWGAGTYINYDITAGGTAQQTTSSGQGGLLAATNSTSNGWAWLKYTGLTGTTPTTQSTLPACDSSHEGMIRSITDGNSTTFNAAISPAGSAHVLAYCDGTSYKVH